MYQQTIDRPVSVEGIGLHTGKKVRLTLMPAEANAGIVFKRVDLDGAPEIPADVRFVTTTTRGTTLQKDEATVATVEHALSALAGMGIDNATLELDGPEMPIMDGTARPFVDAMLSAGIRTLAAERQYLEITEPVAYRDETTGSELIALPSEQFAATAMIDFNSRILGPQYAELQRLDDYASEIAPCRTFVFTHELNALLDMGLIKGGDMDNAIVIADKPMSEAELSELSRKLGRENLRVDEEGILNTLKLRFQNEPARHKLLDVIGDLALVGAPIKGRIVATKPGHTVNVAFARLLRRRLSDQLKRAAIPRYDPQAEPVYNTVQICERLPHRFPFLLVDKIIELSERHVVGVKNVTFNEYFFQGHFPNNPVFPGVLQIEAMAQTGGILALNNVPDPGNWDTYFLKIENARFKAKVLPGDTLLIRLDLLEPIRRGIVHMKGVAYVGDKIVSESEMTAQIVRRQASEQTS